VTNAQFKKFIDAAHYHPQDDLNFLRDWQSGTYPEGWDNKPVTWVSLEDARAYATWAGKRLAHEWEWQYAAQGTDAGTILGEMTGTLRRFPPLTRAARCAAPTLWARNPEGASPFGVMDLVGNVLAVDGGIPR
jgi:iron(II)-dependent oxidoreductase